MRQVTARRVESRATTLSRLGRSGFAASRGVRQLENIHGTLSCLLIAELFAISEIVLLQCPKRKQSRTATPGLRSPKQTPRPRKSMSSHDTLNSSS